MPAKACCARCRMTDQHHTTIGPWPDPSRLQDHGCHACITLPLRSRMPALSPWQWQASTCYTLPMHACMHALSLRQWQASLCSCMCALPLLAVWHACARCPYWHARCPLGRGGGGMLLCLLMWHVCPCRLSLSAGFQFFFRPVGRGGMMIKVKTLTGKEIEIDIEPNDTIERIKERVEEKEGEACVCPPTLVIPLHTARIAHSAGVDPGQCMFVRVGVCVRLHVGVGAGHVCACVRVRACVCVWILWPVCLTSVCVCALLLLQGFRLSSKGAWAPGWAAGPFASMRCPPVFTVSYALRTPLRSCSMPPPPCPCWH